MEGRTVILISHHVQMCAPGARYIVALDNGRVQFQGSKDDFYRSGVIRSLLQSTQDETEDEKVNITSLDNDEKAAELGQGSESSSTVTISKPPSVKQDKKPARKLVEEEKRAVGRIGRDVWQTYIQACGNGWYWVFFSIVLLIASVSPVLENGWLRYF
jgi:ABC-type multidrug transport system ATPase subunit